MSKLAVRRALELRLKALEPALATAYENARFDPPAVTEPYQELNLLSNEPDNRALGGSYFRDQGIFQVSLMYPLMAGTKDVEERAAATRNLFPRGLVLTQDGVTITIEKTPAIGTGFRDRERWRVPVSVRYRAEVFN